MCKNVKYPAQTPVQKRYLEPQHQNVAFFALFHTLIFFDFTHYFVGPRFFSQQPTYFFVFPRTFFHHIFLTLRVRNTKMHRDALLFFFRPASTHFFLSLGHSLFSCLLFYHGTNPPSSPEPLSPRVTPLCHPYE